MSITTIILIAITSYGSLCLFNIIYNFNNVERARMKYAYLPYVTFVPETELSYINQSDNNRTPTMFRWHRNSNSFRIGFITRLEHNILDYIFFDPYYYYWRRKYIKWFNENCQHLFIENQKQPSEPVKKTTHMKHDFFVDDIESQILLRRNFPNSLYKLVIRQHIINGKTHKVIKLLNVSTNQMYKKRLMAIDASRPHYKYSLTFEQFSELIPASINAKDFKVITSKDVYHNCFDL